MCAPAKDWRLRTDGQEKPPLGGFSSVGSGKMVGCDRPFCLAIQALIAAGILLQAVGPAGGAGTAAVQPVTIDGYIR